MKTLLEKFRIFRRAQEGLAYLEFAISLPFLIALFMGSVEVARYIIIVQKVEKSAVTISDVVAQSETISTSQIDLLITAVSEVMQPYTFGANGYVIITAVTQTGAAAPVIDWQYQGGGTWTKPSLIGSTGAEANMPNGLTLNDRDTVIIAEVYYNYQPMMFSQVISGRQLYKISVFKPRIGDLSTLGST